MMTRNEFFDQVAFSEDPLLFTPEHHQQMGGLKARLGDMRGLRVLEPGCGVGPLTEYLSDWVGPEGRVFAFDSSLGMVSRCHERLAGRSNVEIRREAMETIPLEPNAWDLALFFRVFPHLDDKSGMLKRLRPSIASDGRLVISHLEGSEALNVMHAGFSHAVRHDHMPDAAGLRALLEESGYHVVQIIDVADELYAEAVPE